MFRRRNPQLIIQSNTKNFLLKSHFNSLTSAQRARYSIVIRSTNSRYHHCHQQITCNVLSKLSFCRNYHDDTDSNFKNNKKENKKASPDPIQYHDNYWSTNKILDQKEKDTTLEVIDKDVGLKHFLKRVYLHSGLTFVGTLGVSMATDQLISHFATTGTDELMLGSLIIGFIGALGSTFLFGNSHTEFKNKSITIPRRNAKNDIVLQTNVLVPVYSTSQKLLYASTFGFLGLALTPLINIAGLELICQATGISLAVTAGSTLYAFRAKPDSLLKYRSIAYGALFGLVGIGLMSIGTSLFFGHQDLFCLLHSIDLYGGLVLFIILNAIDTHSAINMYQSGNPDHLHCSMSTTLNTLNIFIRILEILAKTKKN